ncbi:MAG: TIGR04282 family arsenosugar biosynthesis glycosyltransferase [Chromatiales bacterium]|nr:TIGR04282 family arsenosugar biosynthesis glycosyltransferase [Chromatiales bacterium]
MQFPNAKLLIFAKAPEVGQVKTRLAPALGYEGAARLYTKLLRGTVEHVVRSKLCAVVCWCAPDSAHPVFNQFSEEYGVELQVQQGEDLGARMAFAARQGLAETDAVVLIGADCPALTEGHLQQVLSWLAAGSDAVLGPAEDGGYVLLGLRRFHPSLFDNILWGSDQVLGVTRERLAALNWRWCELETLWDLDRPEDLERYKNRP